MNQQEPISTVPVATRGSEMFTGPAWDEIQGWIPPFLTPARHLSWEMHSRQARLELQCLCLSFKEQHGFPHQLCPDGDGNVWFGERNKAGDPSRESRDCLQWQPWWPQPSWQHPHQGAARQRILLRSQHTSSKNESKHGNEGRDHGCFSSSAKSGFIHISLHWRVAESCPAISSDEILYQWVWQRASAGTANALSRRNTRPRAWLYKHFCQMFRILFSEKMNCINIMARGTKATNGTKKFTESSS